MLQRLVIPELLDHLPAEDPEAMRSRRDLRRINFLMGNDRWICRTLLRFPHAAAHGIVEMGAGDGHLCKKINTLFPNDPLSAYDLAPRPLDIGSRVKWHQGDLFDMPPPADGGVRIANLFLHHFEDKYLTMIGEWCKNAELLIFCEPDRARLAHLLGGFMHPLINRVTRHDMHVSITAGFSIGEIPRFLGLNDSEWKTEETCTWRGARRVVCSRT